MIQHQLVVLFEGIWEGKTKTRDSYDGSLGKSEMFVQSLWLSQVFTITVGCIVKEIGRRVHQAILLLALKKRVRGLAHGEE